MKLQAVLCNSWLTTVGCNANYLLNVSPADVDETVDEVDMMRYCHLREWMVTIFGQNLDNGTTSHGGGWIAEWRYTSGPPSRGR